MKKYLRSIASLVTLAVLVASNVAPTAIAATTPPPPTPANTGEALEIAPPLLYKDVNPGDTVTTSILIRDVTPAALTVTAEVNDFVAAGEDGTPKVILNNKDTSTSDPYSMRAWVSPIATLTLQPKKIVTLPITINVPANASPGGHYGVVRFTATPAATNGQTNAVSLAASIGSLMLLTVSGNITQNMEVSTFEATHNGTAGSFFQSGPIGFTERLKNTGNVHLQPNGQVKVTDMFGKAIGAVNVNLPPGNVLPGSTRKFSQVLGKSVIGNKHLFGRYTATLTVHYGQPSKTLTSSISFWVIPVKTVAIVIIILIAAFFAIRWGLRRYNRYILSQSQKRPPTQPKQK